MPNVLAILLGRVNLNLLKRGKILINCKPIISITTPRTKVITPLVRGENFNTVPSIPKIPPKKAYDNMRPKTKNKCGLNFSATVASGCFSAYLVDSPKDKPPTRAIQVEKPATSPTVIINQTLGLLKSGLRLILVRPSRFKPKYRISKIKKAIPRL